MHFRRTRTKSWPKAEEEKAKRIETKREFREDEPESESESGGALRTQNVEPPPRTETTDRRTSGPTRGPFE